MRRAGIAAGWALAAAVVWLSLTPAPPGVGIDYSDKLGHLGAYAFLMLWFCLLYLRTRTRAAYAAGLIAMGVALEFIQGALGYRSFELLDMAANTTGVALGWAAVAALERMRAS
jgi:VanZ family protein